MNAPRRQLTTFRKNWFAWEAVPLYAIIGLAGLGGGWYLTYLARRPDVVWARKSNPTPWNTVEQTQNTKLWHGPAGAERFESRWKRGTP